MAIATILERPAGDLQSYDQPVYVHDPAGDAVTQGAAILAAEAAAPSTVFGFNQTGNPRVELVVENVYRVTVRYQRKGDYEAWNAQNRVWCKAFAEPWSGVWAPQRARFPGDAYDWQGAIFNERGTFGGSQPAPQPNIGRSFRIPVANLNYANIRLAARLARAGAVHNATAGAYQSGELALVQFVMQQVDDDDMQIEVGWSYRNNVTNETRGAVAGVSYHGHDFLWAFNEPTVDRNGNQLAQQAKAVYVNQVRIEEDILTPLGVTPP